jgi:hypothetical protein
MYGVYAGHCLAQHFESFYVEPDCKPNVTNSASILNWCYDYYLRLVNGNAEHGFSTVINHKDTPPVAIPWGPKGQEWVTTQMPSGETALLSIYNDTFPHIDELKLYGANRVGLLQP